MAQEIYFQPMEISKDCTVSPELSMEISFRYSNQVYLTKNDEESQFLTVFSNNRYINCKLSDYHSELTKVDTIDITGDHHPELFLTFSFRNGHSGWNGGISESGSDLAIFNLQDGKLILAKEMSYRVESWSNELETPLDSLEEGEDVKIIESYTDVSCFQMDYTVKEGILTIAPLPESEECPSNSDYDAELISLKWTESGFIKID